MPTSRAITGIEGDYDGEEMSFDQAVAIVEQSRLNALLYVSPSHTVAAPQWRAILPTSTRPDTIESQKRSSPASTASSTASWLTSASR